MHRRSYGGSSRYDRRRDRRRSRSRSRSRERAPPRSRHEDAAGGGAAPSPGWGQPPQAQTGWGAAQRSGGWGAPPPSTGWGAPLVAQQGTQGGWATSAPPAPVAPAAAPKKEVEKVLREWVRDGKCCNEADSMCPLSRRFRQGTLLRAEAVGDDDGRAAMMEADCKAKDLKSVYALYCHCRSKKQSGCHYHAVVLFARGVDYLRCLCS